MASDKKTRGMKTVKDLKPRKAAARKVKGGLVPMNPIDSVKRKVNRRPPEGLI